MGKKLWGILCVLCAFVVSQGVLAESEQIKKVEELRGEISLINLVNGLNLTEEQTRELIAINKEVQALKESYKQKGEQIAAESLAAFTELKQSLIENGPNVPPKTTGKANEASEKAKPLKEEMLAKLPPYQDKIESILTEAQKEVINSFKPCLLPPKDQKNPVRAGQAATHEGAVNILRRIRQIPQDEYEQKRADILAKAFTKFEDKHGKLTEDEKAREQARLFGLVDEARSMSDVEFEINKEELAGKFAIKDKREELSEELKNLSEYRAKDKPRLNKFGRFFLDRKMAGVLEAKLVALNSHKTTENTENIK